jgi:hypothetical protein
MSIDDLQRTWRELDGKLERALTFDQEFLRLTVIQSARPRLSRMTLWPALDIAFCLAVLLASGSVLGNHGGRGSLILPAVIVMAGAIALLASSVHQLQRILEVDWSGRVATIQSSLARIHLAKVQQFKWVLLCSPLVGFCGLIVGLQWLLDRAAPPSLILNRLDARWVVANYAFGVLFIPLGRILASRLEQRFQGRAWWRQAIDSLSGRDIRRVRDEVDRWADLQS